MSQYDVVFDEKSNTITLKAEADKPRKASIGHIRADKVGELSEATVHPQPYEHLKNLMRARGIEDYSLVTVVNETDNERLDKLVQTGREIRDDEKTVQVVTATDDENSGVELRAPTEA